MDRRHGHMPRRPPAQKSVSLRHSPPAQLPPSTSLEPQPSTLRPSSVSPPHIDKNQSSGESSDAGRWFENSNHNTQPITSQPVDNDPPFFLHNNSSGSSSPPDAPDSRVPQAGPSIPYRPSARRVPTDGSSTEDYRGVIDDLTIANKKLKQKLKKYEKLHDAKHQDEKLFEVRFHGRLPDHKKKELEETLRKFAQELENDKPEGRHSPVPLATQHATSNLTYPTESGYVSMSASGQNSNSAAPSGHDSDARNLSKTQYNDRQQSIQSYLHDIPVGLLPKHTAPMSDKSKKKLVVRRLEQVFAGKRSTPGVHPQPMQQEEVAQSAATADRKIREAAGQRTKEGHREALIMPVRHEDGMTGSESAHAAAQVLFPASAGQEQSGNGSGSPDQRPTRPLDLDPYRAQVPAENLNYIRHLGFSLPGDSTSGETPQDGQGWIYLNLLINMAQLHTINVTPNFVKDALTEYSSKFELSHDGRKVRWRGGNELTLNSDSSSEQLSGNSHSPDDVAASTSRSPSKLKTEPAGSAADLAEEERQAHLAARAAKEQDRNKLAYTPIFPHKQESDESDDLYNGMTSSGDSPLHPQAHADSSGLGSSGLRSSSSRRKRDDGPMIFYTKANFCTDLSGDRSGMPGKPRSEYKSITSQPLGASSRDPHEAVPRTGIVEPRGPMDHAMEVDSKDGDGLGTSSEDDHEFGLTELRRDVSDSSTSTMEFEASGIGGVLPEDNFAIRVRRSQSRGTPDRSLPQRSHKPRLYPKKILDALDEEQAAESEDSASPQPVINEQIISTSSKMLPSSTLPPPSFLPFDSTSSGDVDSDLESDVSSTPSESAESGRPVKSGTPEPAMQSYQYAQPRREEGAGRDSEDSYSSAGFLAIHPPVDLSTMERADRELDAEFADRLAAEIPAGSSAATAGGGSGFNSPINMPISEGGESKSSGKKAQQQRSSASPTSAAAKANLKRARTSDSIQQVLQEPSKARRMS
ncbi:uncharacterized protein EI97DRAFT_90223 [Westerdykella ornata]|uniref:Frequency clock protein n=1 Tax=Westerdykella ornata TaxID=318751 RepID=A0A6A6JEU3_WESOR|nr:uncharacterized protein EI97DRAFT_90223 [Westerdykella ornata]KAF2274827.1 hypothetical protein EI97DRAFT_90223 [Westerdykella ornata]